MSRPFTPLELIAYAAERLGSMRDEVVFLGGAVVGLLITEEGGVPLRVTNDVDVVMNIATRLDYYRIDERLRQLGFVNDIHGPVCRYLTDGLVMDVMPSRSDVLGFTNRWYTYALESCEQVPLPQGITINLISGPSFLATKMEAFNDPHREASRDIFASRDFADIIRVIDGRPNLLKEVQESPENLRQFLASGF